MLASSRDPYGVGFREVEIVEEDKSDFGRYATTKSKRESMKVWRTVNHTQWLKMIKSWQATPKGIVASRKYETSEKGRIMRHQYYLRHRQERQAYKHSYSLRQKIFNKTKKLLAN